MITSGPVSANDAVSSSHKLQQRTTNTNNNHSLTVAAPIQKTENLHEVKEKETTSSKPPEKLKEKSTFTPVATSVAATIASTTDISADTLNKVKSSLENVEQSSFSFVVTSDKITSPVSVTPEPPAMKRSTIVKDKLSTPKKSQSSSGEAQP